MRNLSVFICTYSLIIFSSCSITSNIPTKYSYVIGKWKSVSFNNPEPKQGWFCPQVGWELEIDSSSSFKEISDEGFHLQYHRYGKLTVTSDSLIFHFGDMDWHWRATYKYYADTLQIFAPRIYGWDATFIRSTDTIKELHRLPTVPRTVDEASELLISELSEKNKEYITLLAKDELYEIYFFYGMHIRNRFNLWGSNKELRASCGNPNMHPDEASSVIIRKIWQTLRNPIDKNFLRKIDLMFKLLDTDTLHCSYLNGLSLKDALNNITNRCNIIIESDTTFQDLKGFEIKLDNTVYADSIVRCKLDLYEERESAQTFLSRIRIQFGLEETKQPPLIILKHTQE